MDKFLSCGRGRVLFPTAAFASAQNNSLQPATERPKYVPLGGHRARGRPAHQCTPTPDPTLAEVLYDPFGPDSDDEDTVTLRKPIPRDVSTRVMDNFKLTCPAVRRFLNLEPELPRITTRTSTLTVRKVAIVTPYRPYRTQE